MPEKMCSVIANSLKKNKKQNGNRVWDELPVYKSKKLNPQFFRFLNRLVSSVRIQVNLKVGVTGLLQNWLVPTIIFESFNNFLGRIWLPYSLIGCFRCFFFSPNSISFTGYFFIFYFLIWVNGKIAGKKGPEGLESSGEASGHSPWPAGQKAGGCDTQVYAGTCSGSGPSQGSVCEHGLRRAGTAESTWSSSKPAWSH